MDSPRLPAGARSTPQRQVILELVAAWQGSFTVAELHERVRRRDPGIGLATTYRTVELLRKRGEVHPLHMSHRGGRPAYVRCGPRHHHHLVCTSCGSVEETDLCGAPTEAEVERLHGFRPSAHELDIYGTCRKCAA